MRFELGVTRAPARILFGAGQRRALGAVAAELGVRVLVCTDSRFAALPIMDEILADLSVHGLTAQVFSETQAELPVEGVHACLARYRAFDPDVIVGLGGGSCLDLAKIVSLLLTHDGLVSTYYGEFKVPGPVRPLILVPTTSGTGSEVTPVAVLADPERAMKVGISSPHLIPNTAICDPELTLSCPPELTAISGADALAHAIEAFAAVTRDPSPDLALTRVFVGKNVLSDQYACSAIRLIFEWLPTAVSDGRNIDARSGLMLASTLAGLAFGTAGTAAAHAIQYPIGALTHTAHGLGVGVLLPYTMAYNAPEADKEYSQIADLVGARGDNRAQAAIDAVRALFEKIGLPDNLAALGLAGKDVDWAAEHAMLATRLVENNPRRLDQQAVAGIINRALAGSMTRELEHQSAAR